MEVGILGPVVITDREADLLVEAPKERALVATLALNVGIPVPPAVLITALWGDDPPATAAKTLQTHVSKLRKLVGTDVIVSDPSGYVLQVDPGSVDAHRFEELLDAGRAALRDGDARTAARLLAECRDLWRGEPLADLAEGAFRLGQETRLAELRLLAAERRIEAELALGHHRDSVGELEALVAEHPFRESLWGQLMVALYRSGRQADALRCFHRLRRVLADELGIEPSAPIVRLESQILRQDAQLDLQPPPPPHNLPVVISSFVGRAEDVRQVAKAVGEHRLVTLLGPGGVGKTRLALEAAREVVDSSSYGDGVWWIDLAAVRDPAAVPFQVATVLGATPAPGTSVLDRVASFVRVRQLLLIVDNCEHLTEAMAELVTRVLEAGPETGVLATSRAPLHLPGEFRRPVEPLEFPPPETTGRDLARFDSVRLFTDRAVERAAGPVDDESLVTVGEICRHLDGIPLAIELAAARFAVLGPTELRERLSSRLDALAGAPSTADARHQTLRAALDWSYELLDVREQVVFDRLAVFPGDFDLPAAEAVASSADMDATEVLDLLARLVDASMVTTVATQTDERRFRLLETMTEYGREHLDEEGFEELRRRHTAHYRQLAADAGAAMEGPHEAEAVARIEREDHNIRPAIEWSLTNEPRSTTLEFANAIGLAWFIRGDFAELVRVLEAMLEDDDGSEPGRRAWALLRLIWPTLLSGDPDRGLAALAEAIELSRLAGDERQQAVLAYMQGQMITIGTGDIDAALPHYEHSLALCSQLGLDFEKVWAILGTAQALAFADRPDGIAEMLDEAESILTGTGDHYRLGNLYLVRGLLCWAIDDQPGLIDAATEGVRHGRAARATNWEQVNLAMLGGAHLFSDDRPQAEGLLFQAARLALDDGNILQVGVALQALSALAAAEDHPTTAARLLGASIALVPFWPLMARRYGRFIDRARDQLGDRFDAEVEAGKLLTPDEAVALALDLG